MLKILAKLSVTVFITAPFLILFIRIGPVSGSGKVLSDEVLSVALLTLQQALASAAASVALGFVGALGLMSIANRGLTSMRLLALLPSAAPILLLILAFLKVFVAFRGIAAIVALHSIINSGVVALALFAAVEVRLSGFAELAFIEGTGRVTFIRRVLAPLLMPDLIKSFLFVFILCFVSFSVPLVLGGSRATTLEVLIWQKIRIDADWSQALRVSAFQMFVILSFSFLLSHQFFVSSASFKTMGSRLKSGSRPRALQHFGWSGGLIVVLAPLLLMAVGAFDSLLTGVREFFNTPAIAAILPEVIFNSFSVSLMTGAFVSAVFAVIAYSEISGWSRRLLLGYSAPSAAITGFAILVVWREFGFATEVKIALAIAMVSLPGLFRLRLDEAIASLRGQRDTARVLGASEAQIFWHILVPALAPTFGFLSGLAAVWAWGDFALSSVIAERPVTLALTIQSLMESYHFEIATALIWVLLMGAVATFFIFQLLFMGVARVTSEEFKRAVE